MDHVEQQGVIDQGVPQKKSPPLPPEKESTPVRPVRLIFNRREPTVVKVVPWLILKVLSRSNVTHGTGGLKHGVET